MLENFPSDISSVVDDNPSSVLDELREREHYEAKGCLPYSPEIMRYTLLLPYTSAQSYKLLLEKFPLPSFSLLRQLHKGGAASVRAAKILLSQGSISSDIILMAD